MISRLWIRFAPLVLGLLMVREAINILPGVAIRLDYACYCWISGFLLSSLVRLFDSLKFKLGKAARNEALINIIGTIGCSILLQTLQPYIKGLALDNFIPHMILAFFVSSGAFQTALTLWNSLHRTINSDWLGFSR